MPGRERLSILGKVGWRVHKPMRVFARGVSLRRRVAYSLALVRLILVPVILLAVYYLFRMGWIVDSIVSVDAPVATLAERASVEMQEARRAERNYFLLHDPADLQENRQALARLEAIITTCRGLQPAENDTTQKILDQLLRYRQQLNAAVEHMGEGGEAPGERIRQVIRAYENDLNDLLRKSNRKSRTELLADLRNRVGSFDAQITETLEADDPALRQASSGLETSSAEIIRLAGELEKRSWERVERGHEEARKLIRRAEWVLGIVSFLTLVLSVAVSFVLPRQVVKPLLDLKEAVDHAAAGNYEIEFDVRGEGEVVQLANSVRQLIAHVREREEQARMVR
jgi:nitrogen fixation/metabolism regulation signal transduction histidine kinase